jgi:hypothetical protein
MTVDSEFTIRRLVEDLRPVARLASPFRRCCGWLAVAMPYVVGLVWLFTLRPDLSDKFADARYVVEQAAALATAVLAAWAAFSMTVPGYDPRRVVVALVPLAVWVGVLFEGCVEDLIRLGWSGMTFEADWICFPMIALVGAWPAVLMVIMLRRGAPLAPYGTIAMGALAAAGLGDVALRLFHEQDVSLTVLIWQIGSTMVLAWLAANAGPLILKWPTERVRKMLFPDRKTI